MTGMRASSLLSLAAKWPKKGFQGSFPKKLSATFFSSNSFEKRACACAPKYLSSLKDFIQPSRVSSACSKADQAGVTSRVSVTTRRLSALHPVHGGAGHQERTRSPHLRNP